MRLGVAGTELQCSAEAVHGFVEPLVRRQHVAHPVALGGQRESQLLVDAARSGIESRRPAQTCNRGVKIIQTVLRSASIS